MHLNKEKKKSHSTSDESSDWKANPVTQMSGEKYLPLYKSWLDNLLV